MPMLRMLLKPFVGMWLLVALVGGVPPEKMIGGGAVDKVVRIAEVSFPGR